ncbi:MAG: DNA pilot protein [Microviridae sp.]|nr:MAG: DNA pilot protein [Microviridae sp.]
MADDNSLAVVPPNPLKSAGIAAGGDVLSTGLGLLANNMLQKQNFKWSEKAADNAFSRQMQLYNRQYQDKSPLNVSNQLKEAGLNPALMYSQGGQIGGAASGSSAPQGAQFQTQGINRQNLALQAAQLQNMEASTANINADTEKKKTEIPNVGADTQNKLQSLQNLKAALANTEAGTALTKVQTIATDLSNQLQSGALESNINMAKQSLKNMAEQFDVMEASKNLTAEQQKQIQDMKPLQMANVMADTALKNANVSLTEQERQQLVQATATIMPELFIKFRQIGIGQQNADAMTKNAETARGQLTNAINALGWDKDKFHQGMVKDIVEDLMSLGIAAASKGTVTPQFKGKREDDNGYHPEKNTWIQK